MGGELYDLGRGPRPPDPRRRSAEWDDPYEWLDIVVDVQAGRRPTPCRSTPVFTGADVAALRRRGQTWVRIRRETELAQETAEAMLRRGGWDLHGWAPAMEQVCLHCHEPYGPWALRRSLKGDLTVWPSLVCSLACSRAAREQVNEHSRPRRRSPTPKLPRPPEALLLPGVVAKMWGRPVAVLRALRAAGQGPPWTEFNQKVMYPTSEARAWVEAHRSRVED